MYIHTCKCVECTQKGCFWINRYIWLTNTHRQGNERWGFIAKGKWKYLLCANKHLFEKISTGLIVSSQELL